MLQLPAVPLQPFNKMAFLRNGIRWCKYFWRFFSRKMDWAGGTIFI